MTDAVSVIDRSVTKYPLRDDAGRARDAQRLLDDIQELASEIRARGAEIEMARRMPLDLLESLRSIGVFRMFVPQSHGGLELDLPTGLEVITSLARVEGSAGWIAMIGGVGGIFAPLLPREIYERVYRNGPDVIFAGSIAPVGTAEASAGGWRVNGRWAFASGCQHADWMIGFCRMTDGGTALCDEGGQPSVRGAFLPARDWQIEDTWYAIGLKGTGSHHISLKDALVSAEHLVDLENGQPCLCGPLYQALPHLLPLFHGAFALGVAEGAVDDLLELARSGRQQLRAAVPLQESEIFQFDLGRLIADLKAARAVLAAQAASHWRHAKAGTLRDAALRAEGTQTGIWVSTTCRGVAEASFRLAGGSAVYDSSPLQRRLRDLQAAGQHAAVQQRHYIIAGRSALGIQL
jgi:indole-3-acetate monooxygenase